MFLWIIRLSNKLDFTKLEPFKILKVLELVTYKLDFSDSMRIIRIHYILILKPVNPEVPLIKDISDIDPKNQEKV